MPISPENRGKYPRNWKAIRARLLKRANYRCEGSPAYPDCRAQHGVRHPVTGSIVVLTVAHLDGELVDHGDNNLAVWCQRCHLTHDRHQHARSARATRARKLVQAGQQPLLK